ncbi:MAG: ornithine carbamoyltransferase [Zymomonas mobilis subsp. pomaceae]|uniref:Ornithine carbamoyltransferase n=1 Tax=Zymomonas mobilis subsp. pomaceae (strain ATCC 29192 / DSM 22645 / JCM 10191 / CCUG 17912 / NBRC 13757 / NCIMB 11200 / NRRL B-4491 / Barker I) TaxID=579138 RepID=F8ESC4_ZYMMT|nr:ornithine carbamoyltransferase [Zymomonas mobilis]AEI37699.1 ornithine carbamoyltransferase [Zymomonas mobilis subsp. pomaceae ATCC 29192]MDX5949066.1 ornithine carbamoyltransferase [Zymomonas mobilis subsp. pomaceae]GEB88871.1 ornithine carbamoyltransferase [Zymomonas mobilis subsp. pomaceae]
MAHSKRRHFLNFADAGPAAIKAMLADALARKKARATWPKGRVDADAPLSGSILGMIFEKNSTRTRVSFDVGMRQLGGTTIVMESGSMQIGRGETIPDTARVLSRYVDAIMIRTDEHTKIETLAEYATVPVINGLTDLSHPCQILADMLTVIEHKGQLEGTRWAWLGDGNNVLHSIIEASSMMGFSVIAACPAGYEPNPDLVAAARKNGGNVEVTHDPFAAVKGADVIVTDTWVSMGQAHAEAKIKAMQPYQVNEALMAHAGDQALFLHCLPAHRGEEVVDAVIDGPHSVVWDEAENRLHAQKSVLLWSLGHLSA